MKPGRYHERARCRTRVPSREPLSRWASGLLVATLMVAVAAGARAEVSLDGRTVPGLAQAEAGHGTEPRELQPRYEPVPPEPLPWYDTSYFFAITRSVAGSTMVPAAKVPLFVLSVPVDIALLPFAAIGGFFS